MIPYRAIAIGVAAAFLFGSGWQVRTWYDGAQDAVRLEAEQKAAARMTELANLVATSTETAIQGIKIENRSIYHQAVKEIVRDPIYVGCSIPVDGLRHINAARGAAAGKPDAPLPGASTTP